MLNKNTGVFVILGVLGGIIGIFLIIHFSTADQRKEIKQNLENFSFEVIEKGRVNTVKVSITNKQGKPFVFSELNQQSGQETQVYHLQFVNSGDTVQVTNGKQIEFYEYVEKNGKTKLKSMGRISYLDLKD